MKRSKNVKIFIENLEKIPNVSLACEKADISRNTIYKWRKENLQFCDLMDEALDKGVHSINDLAESKLIGKIQSSDMRAIEYWLNNNKKNYIRPRPNSVYDTYNNKKQITGFNVIVHHAKHEPISLRTPEEKQAFDNWRRNYKEGDPDFSFKKE